MAPCPCGGRRGTISNCWMAFAVHNRPVAEQTAAEIGARGDGPCRADRTAGVSRAGYDRHCRYKADAIERARGGYTAQHVERGNDERRDLDGDDIVDCCKTPPENPR